MPVERKYFGQGGVNADDADFAVAENDFINGENFRLGSTEKGATARLETVGGTDLIFSALPAGTNINLGSTEDEARQRIVFFNWNSNGDHAIYAFDKPSLTTYTVLLNSQVAGGFNFGKYSYIHSVRIVGNLLYWTDNLNEPRKINIESGIKLNHSGYSTTASAYVSPVPATLITIIKRPPIKPLGVEKVLTSGATNNYIKNVATLYTYAYRFRDGEESALASYSRLMPFNSKAESANSVAITVPLSEAVPEDAIAVDVYVKFGNDGNNFLIKSWDKNNATDLTSINDHNAGTTQLSYTWLNDEIGLAYAGTPRPNDYVPLLSSTLEIARNRLFLGNNLQGYDTPTKSSLSLGLVTIDTGLSGNYAGQWGYVTLHANYISCSGVQDTFMFPFVQSSTAPDQLYYFPAVRNSSIWNGGLGTVPSTININTATFHGATISDLVSYLKATQFVPSGPCSVGTPQWQTAYEVSYNSLGAVTLYEYSSVQVNQFFKSSSVYSVSIAFYDRYRRKCGVVKTGTKISTPVRTYGQTAFTTGIAWALSNTDAVNEIPDWAYYYQIHITKNLSVTSFMQARARNATYITQDSNGEFLYSTSAYATTVYGVALDISALPSFGMGYQFTEGDICRVITSTQTEDLQITGQSGQWIHLELRDLGTLNSSSAILFEIYTPYRKAVNENYYETGDVMNVNNPGTSGRQYSVLAGTINGDTYALERPLPASTSYIVEAMSPNDIYWREWERDFGWNNQIDLIGQQRKTANILFSNTYIPNTRTNGLSTFGVLNQDDISQECGAVERLILTSKVQEDGTVMLVICRSETSSLYLGEAQISDSSGAVQFFAKATGVIGTVNTLRGSYGTINPESAFEARGNVYWYDANKSAWIQYGLNGLFPISSYKMSRPAKLFSKKYLSMSQADVEAQGDRPFIFGGADLHHGECLWSVPTLDTIQNTNGYMPGYDILQGYSLIPYSYDFYDAQGKTWVYKPKYDRWTPAYKFNAEGFCNIGTDLYSFKDGKLYQHNSTTNYCNFYGTDQPAKLAFLSNAGVGAIKRYTGLFIESSEAPNAVYLYANYPNEQVSDIEQADFKNLEGVYYAPALRDRLSPNASGLAGQRMFTGDPMRTAALKLLVEFSTTSRQVYINFVSTEFILSKGHKNLAQ